MQKSILNNILYPEDLRQVSLEQLPKLAVEIRKKIIDLVAAKEGHLGASLGVIELTIALHYVFNTPEDIIVWDVGHQAYGHKILTGRKNKPPRADTPAQVTSIKILLGNSTNSIKRKFTKQDLVL